MPELPEVETICQDLRSSGLVGKPIQKVSVFWHKTITPLSAEEFGVRLVGRTIIAIERRAKFINLLLDDSQ
ncbi:MAG: DNA-formamidopyrimidine glycosylase, partial [Spirochaetae bacterium HGW-Spirochaetae-8]